MSGSLRFLAAMLPELAAGLVITLKLIACSVPLGLVIGYAVSVARTYGSRPLRATAVAYQSAFRGVPLLVQLFLLYYALPRFGVTLSPFGAAVCGFGLCSGAYHSEYIRSALLSIPTAQMEAARALGMRRITAVWRVILPQAVRRSLGGCGNEVVSLVKYSSLAYLVTLVDLTGAGRQVAYRSFRFFETFLIVGLIYLALVAMVSAGVRWLEKRMDPEPHKTLRSPAAASPLAGRKRSHRIRSLVQSGARDSS